MNNDVLALKYRPRFFKEVTGQDITVKTLQNSLELNKIHNAYLFSGTRGMGKTTIARLFAKTLLCKEGINKEPCGKCSTCLEIDNASHLDLIEIDAASRTKVEDTRNLMDNVQYSPTSSRFKIYLIDEVHMLSTKSFNALLKTIEEPPEHVKFLLATTDPEKLPETILSRCLHFKLKAATTDTLVNYLKQILENENVHYDEGSLNLISNHSAGSIRDSLSIVEQCISFCSGKISEEKISLLLGDVGNDKLEIIIKYLINGEAAEIVKYVDNFGENVNYMNIFDNLIHLLYKITISNVNGSQSNINNINHKDIHLYYQILVNSKKDLIHVIDKKNYLIMVLLRMITFTNNINSNNIESGKRELNDVKSHDTEDSIKQTDKNERKTNTAADHILIDEKKSLKIFKNLNITGLQHHLSENSILIMNNDEKKLIIDEDKKDIYPSSCINDFVKELSNYLHTKINPIVEYKSKIESLSFLEQQKVQSNKNNRYDTIKNEPEIKKIEEMFDAQIDKDKIEELKD